jgi:hypothetical protein
VFLTTPAPQLLTSLAGAGIPFDPGVTEVEDCDWPELTDAERAELRGYVGECLLADTDPRIIMQQLYAADDEIVADLGGSDAWRRVRRVIGV